MLSMWEESDRRSVSFGVRGWKVDRGMVRLGEGVGWLEPRSSPSKPVDSDSPSPVCVLL
jgi:hypothetical protein